jgi:hypothetical protein
MGKTPTNSPKRSDLTPPSQGWAWGAKGAQSEGGVINRFATDPTPQEPASSLLLFCLFWVHANGDRHLCNTYTRRDCEAQGTSYWYVFITSEKSGIPFSLRLTLLAFQRPSCSMLSLCANAIDQSDGYFPSGFKGTDPDCETRGRTTARREGRVPPSATRVPALHRVSGRIHMRNALPFSAQTRYSRRPLSSHWVC